MSVTEAGLELTLQIPNAWKSRALQAALHRALLHCWASLLIPAFGILGFVLVDAAVWISVISETQGGGIFFP